jgi:hypothetical protein
MSSQLLTLILSISFSIVNAQKLKLGNSASLYVPTDDWGILYNPDFG